MLQEEDKAVHVNCSSMWPYPTGQEACYHLGIVGRETRGENFMGTVI